MDNIRWDELINRFDKENQKDLLSTIPKMFIAGSKLKFPHLEESLKKGYDSVIILGVGGSAIAGELAITGMDYSGIIAVFRGLRIPSWVSKNTLVICVSYSGNTHETVSLYRNAYKKAKDVVCITTGGKLQEIASMNGHPVANIPKGLPPRLAYPYLSYAIFHVLKSGGIIKDIPDPGLIRASLEKQRPDETGKAIAEKIHGRIPIIISSERLSSAARKWMININETSKMVSVRAEVPEMMHNLIQGFENTVADAYAVILRDEREDRNTARQIDALKKIIREKGAALAEILVRGDTMLHKNLSATILGDWTSYWLALLNEQDPTVIPLIDMGKKLLEDR